MTRYREAVRFLTEQINRTGGLSTDTHGEFVALLTEREIYADDALYDLLANIWTVPGAFSVKQIQSILEAIIQAPFDNITTENVYVIADIFLKLTDTDSLLKYLNILNLKKDAAPIVRFITNNKFFQK